MKRSKQFKLSTKTDLKIFVLFLLDNIRYPIDKTTVMSIVEENTNEIIIDNEEILLELVDSEHLLYDEIDGEKYTFVIESYLTGKDTDVYKAAEALKVGQVVDLTGYVYWYNGIQPHIINISVAK